MYMGIALGLHRTTILKALNYADVVQKLDKKYQRVIGGAAKTFQTKKLPSQSHQTSHARVFHPLRMASILAALRNY